MSDGELLEVEGLNAYYGAAHVLQGLDFTVGEKPVSIIGRDGMGKTTMCHAIMGMHPSRPCARSPRTAPVRFVNRRRAPQDRRQQEQRTVEREPRLRTFSAAGRT